jgi:hypothetical protein
MRRTIAPAPDGHGVALCEATLAPLALDKDALARRVGARRRPCFRAPMMNA